MPSGWSKNPSLGNWVSDQRKPVIKGKLSKERVNRLTAIGFDWNLRASVWEERFHALEQYKDKHGNCNVPRGWPNNPNLAAWVAVQRKRKIIGKISTERVTRLTTIGFNWDPFASVWEESFHALKQYKDKHGNCNVPMKWPKKPGLGQWVILQRKIKGRLSKERVDRLTEIGFDWNPLESAWEENFLALEQYKAKHGDCNVPGKFPENPSLASWIVMQRQRKIKGRLSKERVDRLTEIGFDWNPLESAWEENFLALEQYKAKQGDCNVPYGWPKNPSLAIWVSNQRGTKIRGKLSTERVTRLTALGFDWDPSASVWEENFRALEQYKAIHGDCNVPRGWPKNPGLGNWVSTQRRPKGKGRLSKEQVNRLTVLGFEWHRRRRHR